MAWRGWRAAARGNRWTRRVDGKVDGEQRGLEHGSEELKRMWLRCGVWAKEQRRVEVQWWIGWGSGRMEFEEEMQSPKICENKIFQKI